MTAKRKTMHVLSFACLWLIGVSVSVQARTVRVSLGTLAPKNSSHHRTLLAMGEEWRQAPDGGVRLKVYPSGVVGNESDMVREMRVGGIQAALLSSVGLADIDYAVGNFQALPMMFNTLEEFTYVFNKMQPDFEGRLEERGFVALSWIDAGWVYFFTKEKLIYPEELKGRKIFASANITETIDMWRSGGFNPVALDPTDVTMGLQTGMVDAVSLPPVFAMATRADQAAGHMLDLKWVPLMAATVIHKTTWDQLTPAAQAFVRKSAAKAAQEMIVQGRTENEESIIAMQKRGLQVHHAGPEVVKAWVEGISSMYDTLRGGLVPEDIFDTAVKHLTEFRASQ
jgi:TRAP-type C4-dicarboxylate transport system substrate-binding protein